MSEFENSLYKALLKNKTVNKMMYCPVCKTDTYFLTRWISYNKRRKFPKKIVVKCKNCGCEGFVAFNNPNRLSLQNELSPCDKNYEGGE